MVVGGVKVLNFRLDVVVEGSKVGGRVRVFLRWVPAGIGGDMVLEVVMLLLGWEKEE